MAGLTVLPNQPHSASEEKAIQDAEEKGLEAGLNVLEDVVNGDKVGAIADKAWSSAQALLRKRRDLRGPGAKERLSRFRLPGDRLILSNYEPVRNYKPCIFLPCFLLVFFVEGIAFQQETSLRFSNGTLFTEPPSDVDKRNERQELFESGNLTCDFGNPREYIKGHGLWCPFVLAHRSEAAYPLMWFGVFLITILICYIAASSERSKGNLQVRPGESLIGAYLQIYRAGYKDGHLHLWLVCWISNLLFAILSRRAAHERPGGGSAIHGCIRWGDWEGHWDKCESLLTADTSAAAWTLILVFICFLASLMDHGTERRKLLPTDVEEEEMDNVSAAAVKLKTLVRQQMADTKSRKQKDGTSFLELPKAILGIILQLLSNLSEEVQADFMDDFSDQLEDILSPLTDIKDNLTDKFDHILADIKSKTSSELHRGAELSVKAVDQLIQERLAPKVNNRVAVTKVNIAHLMYQVAERYRPVRQRYFALEAGTLIGVLLGIILYVLLLFQPLGAQFPAMHGDGFPKKHCSDSGKNMEVWCNGHSTGGLIIRYVFYFHEINHIFKGGVRAITIACLVFKFITMVSCIALFQITINKTWEGLDDAGQPMQIMGNVLSSWAQAGSVSSEQLLAWKLARRSLLYNEVALTLDRYENVLGGYVLVMTFQTAALLFHVLIIHEDPDFFSMFGFFYCAVATFTCISRAMTCYYAQKNHIHILGHLKETLLATEQPEKSHAATIKYIDQVRESLTKADYQTYLLYIPLNPYTQKALTGYAASGIAAIVSKYVLSAG